MSGSNLLQEESAIQDQGPVASRTDEALVHGNEDWFLGESFDQIPDIDGDSVDDLVVLYDLAPSERSASGRKASPWQVLGVSGRDGHVLWRFTASPAINLRYRSFVRAWVDWDRDETNDVLLWRCYGPKLNERKWSVMILSGRSGECLGELPIHFGSRRTSIALAPSLDRPDPTSTALRGLLLERQCSSGPKTDWVSHEWSMGGEWRRVQIWSIQPGEARVLGAIEAPVGKDFCSSPVWIQRGVSGEVWGVAILIKDPRRRVGKLRLARMNRGKEGDLEWTWLGPAVVEFTNFARLSAAEVGDVNGDEVSDLVVGGSWRTPIGEAGKVVVLSGATGIRITELRDHGEGVEDFGCDGPAGWGCEFASSVAAVGDLDGDGCDEIAVGSPLTDLSSGSVIIFNLRTDKAVELPRPERKDLNRLGIRIEAGLDFDADGTPDIVAREGWYNNSSDCGPRLHVYSGRSLELIHLFPRDAGGRYPPGTVTGSVVDIEGRPVEDFQVTATPSLGPLEALSATHSVTGGLTSTTGTFALSGLSHGEWKLQASAEGWLPSVPVPITVPLGESPTPTLLLRRAVTLRGRVLDPLGLALQEAEVRLTYNDEQEEEAFWSPSTRTDLEGRFELRGVRPGLVDLWVWDGKLKRSPTLLLRLHDGEVLEDLEIQYR